MRLLFLIVTLLFTACSSGHLKKPSKSIGPIFSGYAPVNGISMYYEIYGKQAGIPLVLIHGGGSTIESNWGALIPLLEKKYRIIAIEEQTHGRTSDRVEPVSFEQT